jgi:hypothetical protein
MHPYLITARPNRWQRTLRCVRRATVTGSVLAAHVVIGLVVLIVRSARVVVTIAATLASWGELYLAERTGRPALGQIAGMGVAAAFSEEFNRASAAYATEYSAGEA